MPKVSDRFKDLIPNYNITAAFPPGLPADGSLGGYGIHLFLEILFKGFSAGIKYCGAEVNGVVTNHTTGQYNGMVGCVQRGETDTMMQFVRYDSTPYEPGRFTTSSVVTDTPKIYSMRPPIVNGTTIDILYLYENLEHEYWLYSFILFMVSMILIIYMFFILNRKRKLKKINILKHIYLYSWEYFEFYADQYNLDFTKYSSQTILFFSLAISIYYGYHLVLFNTVSSDLTVPVTVKRIESLYDLLYEPEFKNVTPTIFKGFNMFSVLSSSREGTDERKLFDRILETKNVSIIEFDMGNLGNTFSKIMDAISIGSVFIENSRYWNMGMKVVSCRSNPALISSLYETKEPILPSPLSMLVSNHLPIQYFKLIEYRLLSASEFFIFDPMTKNKVPPAYDILVGPPQDPIGTIECIEKIEGTYRYSMELTWEPFGLQPFTRLIKICLCIVALCLIIVIIENVIYAQISINTTKVTVQRPVLTERQIRTKRRLERRNRRTKEYPIDLFYYHRHQPVNDVDRIMKRVAQLEHPVPNSVIKFMSRNN